MDLRGEKVNQVPRLKRKKHAVMVSLHLISLFVGIFVIGTNRSYAQNNGQASDVEQTNEDNDTESQKLKVMTARESQITSLLASAVELYKQKRLPEAIEVFNQVIRLDPTNAPAHFSLGIALEANNDLIRASEHYEAARSIEPKNREYQQAAFAVKKKLDQVNQNQLEEAKLRLLTGQAAEAFKQGRYEEALAAYQAIEKENQNLALPKYNIGTIYLIQKKPNDALPYYKAAHKLDPDNKQYSDSLDKLKESIKQAEAIEKQEKSAKSGEDISSENKNNHSAENTAKQDLITFCGLRVKGGKSGLFIEAILTGSRAAQAGLQPGDTISVINGLKITKPAQLQKMLESKPFGQKFQLLVLRGGQTGAILF